MAWLIISFDKNARRLWGTSTLSKFSPHYIKLRISNGNGAGNSGGVKFAVFGQKLVEKV